METYNKHHYRKYVLILAIFVLVNLIPVPGMLYGGIHPMFIVFLFFWIGILAFTVSGLVYFSILWIMDVIRLRGGIQRPKNNVVRIIIAITLSVIALFATFAIAVSVLFPKILG